MEGVSYIQEHINFHIHCSENLTVRSVLCMVIKLSLCLFELKCHEIYVRVKLQLIISNLKLIEIVFKFSTSVMKTDPLMLFKDKNCC